MSLMKRNGVLITCDIPTMQVIKFMDKQEGGKMIIKELDERNVFIHRTFSTPLSSTAPAWCCVPSWRRAGGRVGRGCESSWFIKCSCLGRAVTSIRTRMQEMQEENHYAR
jgi:hypothetical protein